MLGSATNAKSGMTHDCRIAPLPGSHSCVYIRMRRLRWRKYTPTAARLPARESTRSSRGRLSAGGGPPVGGSVPGGVGTLEDGVPATAGDTSETRVAVEVAPAGVPAAGVPGVGVPAAAVPVGVAVATPVVL